MSYVPLSQIPIYKGDNFDFWCIKMKTIFQSQDLWEIVDKGAVTTSKSEETTVKEEMKKDARALQIIQQGLEDSIFSRIASATTAKEAWDKLKIEFKGSVKVIEVRLQGLRQDFESSRMKKNESIQTYMARVSGIITKMRSYGEEISDKTIVSKILRSLTIKFDHVVTAIEKSKDLSKFTFDELMGSLLVHEARIIRTKETEEESAFQSQEEPRNNFPSRGRARGFFRGRGRGRSKWRPPVQCAHCKKTGHHEDACWGKVQCTYCKKKGHREQDFGTSLVMLIMQKKMWKEKNAYLWLQ